MMGINLQIIGSTVKNSGKTKESNCTEWSELETDIWPKVSLLTHFGAVVQIFCPLALSNINSWIFMFLIKHLVMNVLKSVFVFRNMQLAHAVGLTCYWRSLEILLVSLNLDHKKNKTARYG